MSSLGAKMHQGDCNLRLMIVATTLQYFFPLEPKNLRWTEIMLSNKRLWKDIKKCFSGEGQKVINLSPHWRIYFSKAELKTCVSAWRYLSKWHGAGPGAWSRPHNEVRVEASAIFRTRRRRPRQERHLSGTHLKDKHKVLLNKRKSYANKTNRSLQ